MRRLLGAAACAVLALNACQPTPTTAKGSPDRKRATPVAPASDANAPAGRPNAPIQLLARPAGATAPLAGTIALDASYLVKAAGGAIVAAGGLNMVAAGGLNLVAAGAGNVLPTGGSNVLPTGGSNALPTGGSNVLPTGGSNVLPTGGSNLLANRGGQIVAAGGGNIVAAGGGNLLGAYTGGKLVAALDATGNMVAAGAGNLLGSYAGGQLVAAGAGNMVAAGAGNMVAAGGGNVLPTGGGNLFTAPRFTLRQAAAAASEVGLQMPAAGVLVSVVSLRSGRYLPLGVDADGQPVYAVYSNLLGGYEVWLPAAEQGNVAVVVSAAAADPRLNYNLVTEADQAKVAPLDETTALATRYLRRALTGRMRFMLQQPEVVKLFLASDKFLRPDARARVVAMIDTFASIGSEAGVDYAALSDEAADRLAQRVLDASLAGFDLAKTPINARDLAGWDTDVSVNEGEPRQDLPLLDALRGCAWFLHEAAAARLRREPDFFSQAYLAERVNAAGGEGAAEPLKRAWAGEIRKPADVGEFLLAEYLGTIRASIRDPLRRLAEDLHLALDASQDDPARTTAPTGVLKLDPAIPAKDRAADTVLVLMAAGNQLMVEVALRVAADAALRGELRAIVADAAKAP